jgi:cell division protein FtsI (penicillin-binding protein 3)
VSRINRLTIIHGGLALFAAALVGRAAQVQLWQKDRWTDKANRQHFVDASLPAPRGDVTDATGRVLVESRELVRLKIVPKDVRDRRALARVLTEAGVDKQWVRRAVDTTRKWVEIPQSLLPTDVAAASAIRGVRTEPAMERVFSASRGVRRIVGRVDDATAAAVDGVELALDSLLSGTRGSESVLRDARGRRLESPTARGVKARAGNTVVLTINHTLQEICERALDDAATRMGASGGDIVVLDPHRGEILAMASRRSDPTATASTVMSEPFEPGSTIKPFVAAAVLAHGHARLDEIVNTENGHWRTHGRNITDVHKAASLSLRDVIRHSSNIGIVKFAERLSQREQYESLRDLGFGTLTGVPYPAEAAGRLRIPSEWSKQSSASLAMGYELSVTPLQLAVAYASIANGGELLEPALVKAIKSPDGRTIYEHERRVVRRVMPRAVAESVRDMLKSVVDSGTAMDADLATFAVGGKSGTARRIERGQGYVSGRYTATFAGLFPAEDPQYVIVVKLDNPAGVYYGGKTAAPVTKVVLEAAIAARDAALNRASLAARVREPRRPDSAPTVASAARESVPPPSDSAARAAAPATAPVLAAAPPELLPADTAPAATKRFVIDLPARRPSASVALPARAVPDVAYLSLRAAVATLHDAGFRVQLRSGGSVGTTRPAAGAHAKPGTLVTLYREP